jgi:hypothetical protein
MPFFVSFVGYLTALSVSRRHNVEWQDWRIGKDLEGRSHSLMKILFRHLPGETERCVRIVTVLAEIKMKCLFNTGL